MSPAADASPAQPAVAARGLTVDRGGHRVLDGMSFALAPGSITAVFGPSGAGKSTLLNAITGELTPTSGELAVFGEPVPYGRHHALMAMRRRIGVLLQGNGLLSDLTVAQNIALPLRVHTKLPDALIRRIVELKLNAVGLLSAIDLWPRELSGGMARRVALARALALDPPLMLYDEPLTGLDPIAAGVICSLIERFSRTLGITSVVVTHHVHETLAIADRAIVIAKRGIAYDGPADRLQDSEDPLIRQFLAGEPDGPIPFDAGRGRAAVA